MIGSPFVQREVRGVQVYRSSIPADESGDPADVVHVGVCEDDGRGMRVPGVEQSLDTVGLCTGIDYDDVRTRPHQEAVRLEWPHRDGANL
jgi:hypothetical protein